MEISTTSSVTTRSPSVNKLLFAGRSKEEQRQRERRVQSALRNQIKLKQEEEAQLKAERAQDAYNQWNEFSKDPTLVAPNLKIKQLPAYEARLQKLTKGRLLDAERQEQVQLKQRRQQASDDAEKDYQIKLLQDRTELLERIKDVLPLTKLRESTAMKSEQPRKT